MLRKNGGYLLNELRDALFAELPATMEHLYADHFAEVGNQGISEGFHRCRDVTVLEGLVLIGLDAATDATASLIRDQIKVDRLF